MSEKSEFKFSEPPKAEGNIYQKDKTVRLDGTVKEESVDLNSEVMYLDYRMMDSVTTGKGTFKYVGTEEAEGENKGKAKYVLQKEDDNGETREASKQESQASVAPDDVEEAESVEKEAEQEDDPEGSIRVQEFIGRFYDAPGGKRYKHHRWDGEAGETVLIPVEE
jgi:hypothetical protein